MAYMSSFWKKHYPDFRSCCTFYPLQEALVQDTGRHLIEYIDVGWMSSEQMKWAGWDKEGYYVWITPKGMVYRFKSLKRNELGKKYETPFRKLHLDGDGHGTAGLIFYAGAALGEDEEYNKAILEQLKKCAYCPSTDGSGGSNPGSSSSGSGDDEQKKEEEKKEAEKKAAAEAWREYAQGKVPDFSGEGTKYGAPTPYGPENYGGETGFPSDSWSRDYVTNRGATNYGGAGSGGDTGSGRVKDNIPKLPILPPVQMPVDTGKGKIPAVPVPAMVIIKSKRTAADKKTVTGSKKKVAQSPAVPQKKQNTDNKFEGYNWQFPPKSPIDNLKNNSDPFGGHRGGADDFTNELYPPALDLAKDLINDKIKEKSKLYNTADDVVGKAKIIWAYSKMIIKQSEMEDAIQKHDENYEQLRQEYEEAKEEFVDLAVDYAIDAVASEEKTIVAILDVMQKMAENQLSYLADTLKELNRQIKERRSIEYPTMQEYRQLQNLIKLKTEILEKARKLLGIKVKNKTPIFLPAR